MKVTSYRPVFFLFWPGYAGYHHSPGGDEVSRSMVTIGKYVTPELYVSLGRSLFSEAILVTLRYTLSKRFEIETTTGTESGATLYYRIELN